MAPSGAAEEPAAMDDCESELSPEEEQDTLAKLAVMLLSISWTPSAALRTVVDLDIPGILATHGPKYCRSGGAMTAQEMLRHVPGAAGGKPNAAALERVLRLLTCKSVFSEELSYSTGSESESESEPEPGVLVVERRFALTPLSIVLVPGRESGTMANFVKIGTLGGVYGKAMEHLSNSILVGGDAFESAHGMNEFEYMSSHADHLRCFQSAMADHAEELVPLLLSKYRGFRSVRKLIDVGGGRGTMLARIVARHPHLQPGLNFDLPAVVAAAAQCPGVEHWAGDMFHSIPATGCEAIFMKSILHDWDDEDCVKILRNCHTALPEHGKVIVVDAVVPLETPEASSEDHESVGTFMSDFVMLVHCPAGRERHQHEFRRLFAAAGFSHFQVVVQLDYMFVMEALK